MIYSLGQLTVCVKKLFALCTQKQSDIDALSEQITALEDAVVSIDLALTDLINNLPGLQTITTQSAVEDDCYVNAFVTDGAAPTFSNNNGLVSATSINVSGGSGLNGSGRIYTLTFPAHPLGADYGQTMIQLDDQGQPDHGMFTIISKTATQLVYSIGQGDDGGSPDDNDYYPHEVKIMGTNQTFITQVFVNGVSV